MYMSYCRFEGTRQELQACFEVVEEHVNEEAEYSVSDNEIYWFKRMIGEIVEFLNDNDLLEDGEINQTALDDICEAMSRANSE